MSSPTRLDLFLGRIVLKEAYPEKGWIGVVQADFDGKQHIVYLSRRHELYLHVAALLGKYENMRAAIRRYSAKDELVFHIGWHEAFSDDHARQIIQSHIGSKK